jgi:hypothetical protein
MPLVPEYVNTRPQLAATHILPSGVQFDTWHGSFDLSEVSLYTSRLASSSGQFDFLGGIIRGRELAAAEGVLRMGRTGRCECSSFRRDASRQGYWSARW